MKIPQNRKEFIRKMAEFIANDFSENNITQLTKIAKYEDVNFYFDNYEDTFDGMLLYDNKDFHIHINIDKGNTEKSKRGRFTFAHELGHYFIEEHRIGLKYNLLEPHSSFHNVGRKNIIELEADYFASCLLMPKEKFRNASHRKIFSLDKIIELSEIFQVSVLATILRFTEVGTHEIFVVISEEGKVKWYQKSDDFPDWKFNFEVEKELPKDTVAWDFFTKNQKYTEVQEIDADYWFKPYESDERADKKMKEQCYYSNSYGYVISVIWFE